MAKSKLTQAEQEQFDELNVILFDSHGALLENADPDDVSLWTQLRLKKNPPADPSPPPEPQVRSASQLDAAEEATVEKLIDAAPDPDDAPKAAATIEVTASSIAPPGYHKKLMSINLQGRRVTKWVFVKDN